MKTMLTKASIIGVLALYGCGSNTNGEDSKKGQSVNTILEKSEAAIKTPSSMDNGFKSNTNMSPKMTQQINAKSESDGTYRCSPEKTDETDNGTKSIQTFENGGVLTTYHSCSENNVYIDGMVASYQADNGVTARTYKEYIYIYSDESNKIKVDYYGNLTVAVLKNSYKLNGDISLAKYEPKNDKLTILEEYEYNEFYYIEQGTNNIYIDGSEKMKVGSCSTAVSFKYEMPEGTLLTLNSENDNFIDSGEITINDKHYIYQEKDVYVSYKGKSNTFTQQELLDEERIKYTESCSKEPKEASFSKMFNAQFNYKLNIKKLLN